MGTSEREMQGPDVFPPQPFALWDEVITIAEEFKRAGYRTTGGKAWGEDRPPGN